MSARILVVDEQPETGRLISDTLAGEGYRIVVTADRQEVVDLTRRCRPDVVVLDIPFHGLDAFETCTRVRSEARRAGIIVVSERSDIEDRVAGLSAGADDYLTKPFEPEELLARVRAALRRQGEGEHLSPLTGLPGPFDVDRELADLIARGDEFALLLADLDWFKPFNARYGFERGDEAIAATAHLLRACVDRARSDLAFCGHLGGDDFAVVVEPHVAALLADDIVASFDRLAVTLHEPDDAVNGCIEVATRQGGVEQYSLLSISIGVSTNAHRPLSSAAQASAIAAEMRMVAKTQLGSAWRIDRRRT